MAIYSRTLKEFHVLKKNLKKFFQIVYAIHVSTFRLFINENSTVNAMYGVFFVYLSLQPSSHEIWAYPCNMATLLIRPIFLAHCDRINEVPLYNKAWLNTNLAKTQNLYTVEFQELLQNILRNESLQFTRIVDLHLHSYSPLVKTWLSTWNRISPP